MEQQRIGGMERIGAAPPPLGGPKARPTIDDARHALSELFGYDSFRFAQEHVIQAMLDGRDTLAVMPTGAGKSVCYQIPAAIMEGLVLVVSPLVSLMADQVQSLKQVGIRGSFFNSTLKAHVRPEVLRRAADGWYDLMYVAPERLCDPSFLAFASQVKIPLIAVDEAHCVSQWGNDFRPAYRDIAGFVASLPERPRVMALTATATPRVTADVRALLGLNDPVMEVSGFDRPNLKLATFELTPKKREAWTRNYVLAHPHDTGIVYATTRKKVDQIADELREAGVKVAAYHAGMSDKARTDSQQAFVRDDVQVMVATNAFGMGIDKSNVRYVINCGMPQTLEEYYQEAGRAGRDGEPAECYLLWSRGDIRTAHFFIEGTEYPEGTTLEEQHQLRNVRESLLGAMIGYAMSTSCLRARVLRYFGQWLNVGPEGCGGCSVCLGETADAYLREPRKKKERKRTVKVAEAVVVEEARESAVSPRVDKVDEVEEPQRPGVTPHVPADKGAAPQVPSDAEVAPELTPDEADALFQRLRALRKTIADANDVPPYIVFSDRTLRAMVRQRPRNDEELLEVPGVGKAKLERYGSEFLYELWR